VTLLCISFLIEDVLSMVPLRTCGNKRIAKSSQIVTAFTGALKRFYL